MNRNQKIGTGGLIVAVVGVLAIVGTLSLANKINNNFASGEYVMPTAAELREKCTEKVRELLETEPTQYMIDVCVRAANNELNSSNPLSANPTVEEVTAKCTEMLNKEYGSAPKLEVNMCVGTIFGELNK